jgi:hypothetical protein
MSSRDLAAASTEMSGVFSDPASSIVNWRFQPNALIENGLSPVQRIPPEKRRLFHIAP